MASWCLTFAFIGFAVRFFDGHSDVRRYIADSSYWLYLIHFPIVFAGQIILLPYDWNWAVKYSLIMTVSLTLMLVSYQYLVRYSCIGAILGGKRRHKPSGEKGQEALA